MPEWFESLEPAMVEQVTAKGWNKPAADVVADIFKSHSAAQSVIGSDPAAIIKLPKDATDPAYQAVYDRVMGLAAPKDPAGYVFDGIKYKDGSALDADDQAFIRDIAAKHKLPLSVATSLATELVQRTEAAYEAGELHRTTVTGAQTAALAGAWGIEKDQRSFKAAQAVEALKSLGLVVPDTSGLEGTDYVKHMNGLVTLAGQLGEAAVLRGGGGGSGDPMSGMTSAQAQEQLNRNKEDAAWVKKALFEATSDEAKQFARLQQIIAQRIG
jgi:hypothetical protein